MWHRVSKHRCTRAPKRHHVQPLLLFDVDAVLLAPGPNQVRGRPAIANVIIKQLRDGGSYVAAPNLVLQSGPLALIISANATSVASRTWTVGTT
jgi:hypothetical protein